MLELSIIFGLLILGYLVGSYRERKHYESITRREQELHDIMAFETKVIPEIVHATGGQLVKGNVVISVDYFKSFVAGLRLLVGGRLKSYETLLDRARREAILRMKKEARELGANKVFNVKFETSSISKGQSGYIGSIEVYAYGTALTLPSG